jgi:hypothetical protein
VWLDPALSMLLWLARTDIDGQTEKSAKDVGVPGDLVLRMSSRALRLMLGVAALSPLRFCGEASATSSCLVSVRDDRELALTSITSVAYDGLRKGEANLAVGSTGRFNCRPLVDADFTACLPSTDGDADVALVERSVM